MTLIKQAIDEADTRRLWEYRLPSRGATDDELQRAERVLGEPLDPAYRRFLGSAGGWLAFYQMVDLLGHSDLVAGPRFHDAATRLRYLEDGTLRGAGVRREELLPIAVSRDDRDLFVMTRVAAQRPGRVLWFAGELIDQFPTFDDHFLAMMDYNRRELDRLRDAPVA